MGFRPKDDSDGGPRTARPKPAARAQDRPQSGRVPFTRAPASVGFHGSLEVRRSLRGEVEGAKRTAHDAQRAIVAAAAAVLVAAAAARASASASAFPRPWPRLRMPAGPYPPRAPRPRCRSRLRHSAAVPPIRPVAWRFRSAF